MSQRGVASALRNISMNENEKLQRVNMRLSKYKFDIGLVQQQLETLDERKLHYEKEIRDIRKKISKQIHIRNSYLCDIAVEKEKQNQQILSVKNELYVLRDSCDKETEKIRALRRDIREEKIERENLQQSLAEHKQAAKDKEQPKSKSSGKNNRLQPPPSQAIVSPRTRQRMTNFKHSSS